MPELTLKEKADDLRGRIQRRSETIMLLEARLSGAHAEIAKMTTQVRTEGAERATLQSELDAIDRELHGARAQGMVAEPEESTPNAD